jgi:2-iminobutanoate/2-iminopropanoate deaminase
MMAVTKREPEMVDIRYSNPPTVRTPAARYSMAVEITGAERRLVISGQVGMAVDGTIAATPEGQVAQIFANLTAILAAHGMNAGNVVCTRIYVTDRIVLPAFRAARDAYFAQAAPASTLLIVSGLADPTFLIEIEAEAVG